MSVQTSEFLNSSNEDSRIKKILHGELGQEYKHRWSQGDDKAMAMLAQALIRLAKNDTRHLTEAEQIKIRSEVAIQALEMLDDDRAKRTALFLGSGPPHPQEFPETREVFWSALLHQWLTCPSDQMRRIARYIVKDRSTWTKEERNRLKSAFHARLKEWEDKPYKVQTLARVLATVDPDDCDLEVVNMIGRSLGHFANVRQLQFIGALFADSKLHHGFLREAAQMVTHQMKKLEETIGAIAYVHEHVYRKVPELFIDRPDHITLTWSGPDVDADVEAGNADSALSYLRAKQEVLRQQEALAAIGKLRIRFEVKTADGVTLEY